MSIPKPLLPLGEVPILEIIIQQLANQGIKRIALCLGHMGPVFIAYLAGGERWGVKIDYYHEQEPLGTAGALRLVRDLTDAFLVMNGDVLTMLDYRALIEQHVARAAWGTIAAKRRKLQIDFGVLRIGADHRLQGYDEKPTIAYEVSMGINVLSRQCLAFIPATGRFDMPQLMLAMREAGKPVYCHRTTCYWQDIGRFDDYQKASADFVANPRRFLKAVAPK
jgi:NDP-sugar pyrophosphorylase family protein